MEIRNDPTLAHDGSLASGIERSVAYMMRSIQGAVHPEAV
jgi:hypothetical protein